MEREGKRAEFAEHSTRSRGRRLHGLNVRSSYFDVFRVSVPTYIKGGREGGC